MIKMMMRNLILLVLLMLCASCGKTEEPSPFHAIDVTWQHQRGNDFRLAGPNGKVYRLIDFRGKVVVLFFGFTHCPEVCPNTLSNLAGVMRLLGKDAEKVQVLFVTLDPERDTPAVLAKFVPSFHPSFMGLYGDAEATAKAASAFNINFEKHAEKDSYTIDHSDGTYLIGATGKPVLLIPYGQPIEALAQDIKLLLNRKR
jgi:protein SCO1/2